MARRKFAWLFVALACVIIIVQIFSRGVGLQPDSWRYVTMGLNLLTHGILTGDPYGPTVTPAPGLAAGGPFTAVELAAAGWVDAGTYAALECLAVISNRQDCGRLLSLEVFYSLEISIFLACLFWLAQTVFQGWVRPALALGLALLFRDIRSYSHDVLTEPSYLMFLGLFLVFWLQAVRANGKASWWGLVGLALGAIAMVKPAWNAYAAGMGLVFLVSAFYQRDRWRIWAGCYAALLLGWAVMIVPLFVRNGIVLGYWGLNDQHYLVTSLSHRFAYNAMPWRDVIAGFLYYMPDFGDNAARALFGADTAARLSWDPQSYYVYGRDVLNRIALSQGTLAEAKAFLWREHFFNDPVKSGAVTGLLVWRGLFVGHLFGLVALALTGPVLWFSSRETRYWLAALGLPVLLMAGVHALVSVSIPRYNLGLIVFYSMILAQFLYGIGVAGYRLTPKSKKTGAEA